MYFSWHFNLGENEAKIYLTKTLMKDKSNYLIRNDQSFSNQHNKHLLSKIITQGKCTSKMLFFFKPFHILGLI